MNVLISACLLGIACRYDGASKRLSDVDFTKLGIRLIPICPESEGGLPTPRPPAERVGDRVVNREGADVTDAYLRGAEYAVALAAQKSCPVALLKERSPSCGNGRIYDGSFSGRLTDGDGTAAERLKQAGVTVFGESEIDELLRFCERTQNASISRESIRK